jgi:hypothetical protein
MRAGKHHQVWIEQCDAARTIRERFGLEASFDYAVGEKLMNFASVARDHSAFARELPRFVSEVRRLFSADEIRTHLERLEREETEKDAETRDPDEYEVRDESRPGRPSASGSSTRSKAS